LKSIIAGALLILGIWTFVTGIMDSEIHIFAGCASTVVICIHVWLNRKSFLQRFRGLGWMWMLIGLGILITIAAAAD
jgi:hypothetical protein